MSTSTEEIVDGVLAHYGVRGMKWGVRKRDGGAGDKAKTDDAPARKPPKSEDAKKAEELSKKPVTAMSNAELEALTRRLQLEQSYASLQFKQDTREIRQGQEIVKTIMGTAQLAKDVTNIVDTALNSPASQIIRGLIRG